MTSSPMLRLMLDSSFTVVGLSGAGITLEHQLLGLGNDRHRHHNVNYADFMAHDTTRRAAWKSKFAFDDTSAGGRQGPVHSVFSQLVASGKMTTILTQATDRLHRSSGVPKDAIVELHGNDTHARCTFCGVSYAVPQLRRRFQETGATPLCLCGGNIKPDFVMQGEPLSSHVLCRAVEAVESCDLLLVIGSALRTFPACDLPSLAKDCGARVVIVNNDATPADGRADLIIRENVADVLGMFISLEAHR